jgi:hypothetical protein
MPATFSINSGQLTESTRKPNIFSVLNDIQDNTQKLISPRDVRDAFLSTWANSPFKITTPNSLANFEYIGIDSNNPGNRDIKEKILLGKRSYGNLDVMNDYLLGSETDIFLFNTKPDSVTQSSTKIGILAGTNSGLYNLAPYIESKVDTSGTSIDLNIINPALSGAINILSTTGRVSINQVLFPTVAETFGSASDGRILRYRGTYPSGYLKWEDLSITVNSIGTLGYETNIYGSTVSVNGYPIEFIDDDYVPTTIGGVATGSTFPASSFFNGTTYQNWPVTEVLKELLYPYVPPILELSVINTTTGTTYAEVGTTASVTINSKITTYQRNVDEKIFNYQIIPNTSYTGLSFSGLPGSFVSHTILTTTYSSAPATALGSIKTWTLNVSDSSLITFSYSKTATIQYVYPIYYGFTSSIITPGNSSNLSSIVSSFNKLILPYPGLGGSFSIPYNGSGYIYFIHVSDSIWEIPGTPAQSRLQQIQDPNGFIIHERTEPVYSSFTSYLARAVANSTHPSPGYPRDFRVWRSKWLCAYPGPYSTTPISFANGNGNFKFIF